MLEAYLDRLCVDEWDQASQTSSQGGRCLLLHSPCFASVTTEPCGRHVHTLFFRLLSILATDCSPQSFLIIRSTSSVLWTTTAGMIQSRQSSCLKAAIPLIANPTKWRATKEFVILLLMEFSPTMFEIVLLLRVTVYSNSKPGDQAYRNRYTWHRSQTAFVHARRRTFSSWLEYCRDRHHSTPF